MRVCLHAVVPLAALRAIRNKMHGLSKARSREAGASYDKATQLPHTLWKHFRAVYMIEIGSIAYHEQRRTSPAQFETPRLRRLGQSTYFSVDRLHTTAVCRVTENLQAGGRDFVVSLSHCIMRYSRCSACLNKASMTYDWQAASCFSP